MAEGERDKKFQSNSNPEQTPDNQPQAYGQGQHPRKAPGKYKAMNEGLVATIALDNDLQSDYPSETH